MIFIHDNATMQATLASPIDPGLRILLSTRMGQLSEYDLSDIASFLIVEAGDSLEEIEGKLGFPIATNFVDGCRYGDPGFDPSWEDIADHGGWVELTYVLSDDGKGWVILVPDAAGGVDPELLALCRCYAVKAVPTAE